MERIPDSEEVGERVGDEYYRVFSDPIEVDSDGDGFDDYDEQQIGTDPFDADTDDDETPDAQDATPFTKPSDEPDRTRSELRSLIVGAVKGEVGFSGIDNPLGGKIGLSKYRDSPYYLAGWVIASIAPGADIVADLRDFTTNVIQGEPREAALDAAGLIPILGKVGDSGKAIK